MQAFLHTQVLFVFSYLLHSQELVGVDRVVDLCDGNTGLEMLGKITVKSDCTVVFLIWRTLLCIRKKFPALKKFTFLGYLGHQCEKKINDTYRYRHTATMELIKSSSDVMVKLAEAFCATPTDAEIIYDSNIISYLQDKLGRANFRARKQTESEMTDCTYRVTESRKGGLCKATGVIQLPCDQAELLEALKRVGAYNLTRISDNLTRMAIWTLF